MTINIKTTNDAFGNGYRSMFAETARILRELADKLDAGESPKILYDINGNKCGSVRGVRDPFAAPDPRMHR